VTDGNGALAALEVLIGEWSLEARFDETPSADIGARTAFEWLSGEQFVVQRWSVPLPEAPDGIALIGLDAANEGCYLQHYFDSRGVARIYRMTLENRIWKLWRDEADFSPLDFRQRYTATVGDDGQVIVGTWEICSDGTSWETDFELTCRKLSSQ
jgi:hypothetical protein